MQLQQVDGLDPQPAQASLDLVAKRMRPSVFPDNPPNPGSIDELEQRLAVTVVPAQTNLGENLDAVAAVGDGLAQRRLGVAEAVQGGGVEAGDAALERGVAHAGGLGGRARGTSHAPEDDPGDLDVAMAEPDALHARS
jgi:hypothetical protein